MNQAALELLIQLKDEATAGLQSIGNTLTSVGDLAVAGFASAASAVGGFIVDSVKAAAEAQDAVAQLDAVITSTGGAAGVTSQELQDLAGSLQQTTKFGEETTIAAESILLTFTGIGKEVFPDATRTTLDMAQALGTDAKGAAMQLGKALNDPVKGVSALTKVGVSFTEEQKAAIQSMVDMGDVAGGQKIILAELAKEFGGSAEAAGKTFSGQLVIAENMLGEFGEMIGGKILPLITPLISSFIKFATDALPKVEAALEPVFKGINAVSGALKLLIVDGASGTALADYFQDIGTAVEKLFGIKFSDATWKKFLDIADQVQAVFYRISKAVETFKDVFASSGDWASGFAESVGGSLDAALESVGIASRGFQDFGIAIDTVLDYISAGFSEDGILGAISSGIAGLMVAFGSSEGEADSFATKLFQAFQMIQFGAGIVVSYILSMWPMIQSTISTVIGVIVDTVIPMLVQGFSNIVAFAQVLIQSIVTNWPKIQATIEQVINAVVTNVLPILITVIRGVQEVMQKIVDWVIENWPLISATVTRVIQAIGNVIAVVLPIIRGIFETVFPIIKGVVETAMDLVLGIIKTVMQLINGNTEGALETLRETFAGVWDKIKSAAKLVWDQIVKVIKDAVQDAIDWVNGIGDQMKNIGANIILDIVAGIRSAPRSILNALRDVVNSAIDDIKRALGIHSDSTVMMDIGKHMMGGLATGIVSGLQSQIPQIQAAMSGVRFSVDTNIGAGGQRPSFASTGNVTVNIYANVSSDVDIDDLAHAVAKRVQASRGR